ncbi:MAG: M3 family oligoendopeptidase [Erysipelotrichia bacterium]|jgi:pepF/M3 family oligoendopeptidase|nr:M3 family oligoendopeptidase [Erysipelotrichia bacterium]
MNTWDLTDLYPSLDDASFSQDISLLTQAIQSFEAWSDTLESLSAVEVCESYLKQSMDISTRLSRLSAFASLTSATDATNSAALNALNQLQLLSTKTVKGQVAFIHFLKSLDSLEPCFSASKLCQEHAYLLETLKKQANHVLSAQEELIISKMSINGSTAWTNLQNKITSTLNVEVSLPEGVKTMPLPAVRNLAYSDDAAVRKAGYEAEMKAYSRIEDSSAAALNGIKGEVLTLNELKGYEGVLSETLIKSRMSQATLDAMLSAIRKYLPSFRKYLNHKAKLLGHSNGLPFYDMFAPINKNTLNYTYKEASDFVVAQFATFSQELADFTTHAIEKKWIDVEPRPGKRGGAFCSNLHPIKQSRVLLNFDGSFSNLTTLAHELGHAYHGHCLKDETILNSRYPMPIAETASIFCETIVVNAALKEADKENAIAILEASISDATQVIVDIYSRYLFETSLFKARETQVLDSKQLQELMLNAQKEAYGDGLDNSILHPYMWLNKPHYYSAGLNFYNFPYAFGLLFSKGLYAQYLKEGESFVSKYNDLLQATGKHNIKDVAAMAHVNSEDPKFYEDSLELVAQDIEKFIQLTSQ